jgi:predicted metal-binding membrane protein
MANLTAREHVRVDRAGIRYGITAALLTSAAFGWWWSVRMSDDMRADGMLGMNISVESAMSVTGFLIAWLAMMVAMMFPAVTPVVKLYARASEQRRVAPLPYFVLGYLTVWTLLCVPAFSPGGRSRCRLPTVPHAPAAWPAVR